MPDNEDFLKKIAAAENEDKVNLRLDLAYKTRISNPQLSTEQALAGWEEAKSLPKNDLELRAAYLVCTSALYNDDFQDIELWIDRLAQRGMELNHNPSIGRSYIIKSRWSARLGKKIEAAEFLLKAIDFFDSQKNISDIASCYNGLGNIYNDIDDLDNALKYFKKALPYARKLNLNTLNVIKQNIALVLVRKKEYAPAWKIFDYILDNIADDDYNTQRVVLLNLAHICQKTEEFEQALTYLDEAITISKNYFSIHYQIRPICNKAIILADIGDFNTALLLLENAEKLSLYQKNDSDLLEVYYGFSQVYEKQNNYAEQVKYLKEIIALEKKLNQNKSSQQVKKFEKQHHINMYKEKNILLQERNKLVKLQNDKLKKDFNQLICQNNQLEKELLNALKNININDDYSESGTQYTTLCELLDISVQKWKQPISAILTLFDNLREIYKNKDITPDVLAKKADLIEELINSLQDSINDFQNNLPRKINN